MIQIDNGERRTVEEVPSCFSGGKFMKMWYAHRGNIHYGLLRSGLGLILLIGLLSFGTGGYSWRMIETATEIRHSTGKMLTQRSLARNAEKDFRLSDLLESEFYQGSITKNLGKHQAAMAALEAEIQEVRRLLPDEEDGILDKLQRSSQRLS